MNVTTHTHGFEGQHAHVVIDRGPRAGTWTAWYERTGPAWRVRSPAGTEHILSVSGSWSGDLAPALDHLLLQVSRRAVMEVLQRDRIAAREPAPPASKAA